MKFLDSLISSTRLPRPLYLLLEAARLRRLCASELTATLDVTAIAKVRLEKVATRYSRKQIGSELGAVKFLYGRLQLACERSILKEYGRKYFESTLRELRTAVKNLQKACDLDAQHESELLLLEEERRRLVRETAPFRIGKSEEEIRRYNRQFQRSSFYIEGVRELAEMNQRLSDMRSAVASLQHFIDNCKKVEVGIERASAALASLDRASLAGDSSIDEMYARTARILEEARERGTYWEVSRSVVLLDQVDQNLKVIRQYTDRACREAAEEVKLWNYVASMCPNFALSFATELSHVSPDPSGEALNEWRELRARMEAAVNRKAEQTRLENSKALKKPAFEYKWFDKDEEKLTAFAKASYRAWQRALSGRNENRSRGKRRGEGSSAR